MSTPNIFIPSNQVKESSPDVNQTNNTVNQIKQKLTTVVQFLVIATIGFLPFFFVTGNDTTLSFDRTVLLSVALGTIVGVSAILTLFQKRVQTILPISLFFLAGFVVWGFISAYASGDTYDAIWGVNIGVLSVMFSLLLLVTAAVPLLLQSSKSMLIRALALIQGVSLVILLHTLLWYWFGFSFLSFGESLNASQSLIGGFNDSAIYAGLLVIFALTTLVMLPLRLFAQVLVAVVMALALSLLLLVNFSLVWVAVLVVSAITTGYVLLRKHLFQSVSLPPISGVTKAISFATFLIALVALLYGSSIASSLNTMAKTQFIEVRPNLAVSADIVREVYEEDIFLGIGPNRYEDAWRLYKNVNVNESVFWNTTFTSGHSYVVSVFTTYGLVGGLLLVLFHLAFLWFGINRLTTNTNDNLIIRYVITTVFVGAVFLWLISYVYTPGSTMLLLAAALTGLTFAASTTLEGIKKTTIDVITNRVRGFVVLTIVLILVLVTWATVRAVLDKYQEQNNIVAGMETKNDEVMGVLANQRIAELSQLIANASPETVTQEDLLEASSLALSTSRQAIELDPTNPIHHQRLATLYGILGAIGVDRAYSNAQDTLATVKELDPKNPAHDLALARVLLAAGDMEGAAVALDDALELKPNYSEAIRLQTSIAIESGDTSGTITRVENATKLDPSNATRWYQLGLLYAASGDTDNAIQVLLRALRLDPSYADARYVLALQYVANENTERALSQLRLIQETNPDNPQLESLITSIENGEDIQTATEAPSFNVTEPSIDNESGVSVPSSVSSDLFAPVNQTSGE